MAISIRKQSTGLTDRAKLAVAATYERRKGKLVDPVELSEKRKREQREEAQRIHARLRERLRHLLFEFQDGRRKSKGLSRPKYQRRPRMTKEETALQDDIIEMQAGVKTAAIGVTTAAAAIIAGKAATNHIGATLSKANDVLGGISNLVGS